MISASVGGTGKRERFDFLLFLIALETTVEGISEEGEIDEGEEEIEGEMEEEERDDEDSKCCSKQFLGINSSPCRNF